MFNNIPAPVPCTCYIMKPSQQSKCCCPHFTDEEPAAQRGEVCEFTQIIKGQGGIRSQANLTPKASSVLHNIASSVATMLAKTKKNVKDFIL